ncbi:MAG: F0F1 ATP synthase subunit delta [Lachnospiraceae bacterium]|nr:F0F1 ATP synthase subunit delta [Lachnospiraceae bacterium]
MAKLVSKTYGEALFEIAIEENKAQELMEEIGAVQKALKENVELDKLLKHPGIPKQEKMQVMDNIFKGRVSDELTGFLQIVISKERYNDLQAIFQYFIDKVKEVEGIGVAYVTTAVELTEDQKTAVQSKLLQTTAYQTMEMHYSVDSSLIGGMVIRINDRVVDSSIRTKLNDMTKQLLNIQLG